MEGSERGGLEFELTVPGFFRRPDYFEVLAALRRTSPVHRSADGLLAVSRYEDVRAISRDPARFVSGRGVLINDPLRDPATTSPNTFSILHLDPPLHATYRSVVNRQFTPRAVAPLVDRIRSIVSEVLDAVPPGRVVDFVDAVAAPIPCRVILDLLGIGGTDAEELRRWSDAAIESTDRSVEERSEDLGLMAAFLLEHIDSPATESNDLLNLLKTAPVGDRLLTRAEIMGFCVTLLVAGNETTRTLLSGGVEALAGHPDQLTTLAGDRSLLPGAVEEMVRWVTPIQAFARTAVEDVEIAGVHIAAGEFVVLLYASANRDETVFGDGAATFDVSRPALPGHLAFGFGEHVCLGASLARLEARVFFQAFLDRFREVRVEGAPTYADSTLVRGAHVLPVVLG